MIRARQPDTLACMRRLLAVFAIFLAALWVTPGSAEPQATPDAKAIKAAGFEPDDIGFVLIDLDDGRALAEQSADALFIPASVAKLTFSAALAPDRLMTNSTAGSSWAMRRMIHLAGTIAGVIANHLLPSLHYRPGPLRSSGGTMSKGCTAGVYGPVQRVVMGARRERAFWALVAPMARTAVLDWTRACCRT